jgi:vanillate O-demethylase ferredoxin subunit
MIQGPRLPQDHRDLFLTDEEHAANDCTTVCCSRSRSALLVLDLTPC